METYENDSLLTSKLSDSEDATLDFLDGFFNLPTSPAESESDDDTVSTSEAVDRNSRDTLVEMSNPRDDVPDKINIDLSETTSERSYSESTTAAKVLSDCGQSDSEDSSEEFSFFRPRPGLLGFYDACRTRLWKSKLKGYFLPFQLLWLAFSIACCFMGANYWLMCPADLYIPRYVFLNGTLATISWCVEIMDSLFRLIMRRRTSDLLILFSFGFSWVSIITTFIEMIQFYTMSYSFNWNEENYCNEKFYWFVYYKNIAFSVLMFVAAWIYIESIHWSRYTLIGDYESDSDDEYDGDDDSFYSENSINNLY